MALKFDAVYYFLNRPDVLAAYVNGSYDMTPAEFAEKHFRESGWKEGSNPNAVFNVNEYLAENPDVAAAGVDPFLHYEQSGQFEGRAPNATFPSLAEFDFQAYLDANPDLVAAGLTTPELAYEHYINTGYLENRPGAPGNANLPLSGALQAVQDADDALADFLVGADGDDDETTSATVDEVNDSLDDAETALASARTGVSDRVLRAVLEDAQEALADAQADIDAVPGLAAAIARLQAAQAAEEAADEVRDEAQAEVLAAEARYEALNGPIVINADGTVGGVIISVGGELVLVDGVDEESNQGVTELLAAIKAGLAADEALDAAQDETAAAQDEVDTLDVGPGEEAALAALQADIDADGSDEDLEDAVVAAQAEITERTNLENAVADAQAEVDERADLEAAVDDSQALVDARVPLDAAVANAEAESDAFDDAVAEYNAALALYDGVDPTLSAGLVTAYNNLAAFDPANFTLTPDAATIAAGAAATQTDINTETAAQLASVSAAQNALNADIATNGTTAQLNADLADAQTALTTDITADGTTAELNADLTDAQTALTTDVNADGTTAALNTALADAQAEVTERADLRNDVENSVDSNPLSDALTDAQDAVDDAQGDLDDRAELIQDVADAEALVEQLEALQAGQESALAALEDLGFDAPEVVAGATSATAESDLFIYAENVGIDEVITGLQSDDALFIGSGFTVTKLADDANLDGNTDYGSVSALDIFLHQEGADTVVYIETDTFNGQQNGAWAGESITLVGVDVDNVSIENGILRVAEPTVA